MTSSTASKTRPLSPDEMEDEQVRDRAIKRAYANEDVMDLHSPNSSDTCEFCGARLEYHEAHLNRRTFRFRAKPCTCEQAQAKKTEIQRQKEEYERQAWERIQRERIDALKRASLIPERWETRTFDHFERTPANEGAYQTALQFASQFAEAKGKGLIFTGTVGTGKTHLSAAIAWMLLNEGSSVVYGTVATLLAKLRSTYNDDKVDERQVFDKFVNCDLLIIDDLGKEKVTEWADQVMFEIINTRYERNKSLVITTNMRLSALQAKYENTGAALVSRILEMCQGVQMDGIDWRKQRR